VAERSCVKWAGIPVYITNRNRLSTTSALVNWLLESGTNRVTILDNDSTYKPLLAYYENLSTKVQLLRLGENVGPWAFWAKKFHLNQKLPYIVTDSDLVPDRLCPLDLIGKLMEYLVKYPECQKVGPGLRIDDGPDLEGERKFWGKRCDSGAFYAAIDTTFALYDHMAETDQYGFAVGSERNLRLDKPYLMRHMPWYATLPLSEEENYYRAHANPCWSTVAGVDLNLGEV